jgi:hypothetical protein
VFRWESDAWFLVADGERGRVRLPFCNHEDPVTVSDLRQLTVLSPEVADFMTTLLVRNGPKIERSAFLVTNLQSSLGMQLVRMMSASKSQGRRVFDRADQAASYVEEVLTEPERLALRKFLA